VGILTDVPGVAFADEPSRAAFLLWPVLPSPTYDAEPSFVVHLQHVHTGDLVQFALVSIGLAAGQGLATLYSRDYASE
jgi:hypothetical protein